MGDQSRQAFVFFVSFFASTLFLPIRGERPVNVGMINVGLPGDLTMMLRSCVNMAFSDFYSKNGRNHTSRIALHIRNSKGDVVAAAAGALDLIKNAQVEAVLGPPTSMEAKFVMALGDKAQVPIVTVTATDPSLSSVSRPYFFRASQSDATQTGVIRALMKAFRWKEAVPIYEDNEFGEGILPFLVDAFESINVRIPYRSAIPADASDESIHAALSDLMTMSTRVFIVHTRVPLGKRIFSMATTLGMLTEGYVWILTDAMTNFIDSFNSSALASMEGVVGVRTYIQQSAKLRRFNIRWRKKYREDNPGQKVPKLNIYGLWAYDAATALANAVEMAAVTSFDHTSAKDGKDRSTDLDTIPVSVNGPYLAQSLSTTNFSGLTGNFGFVRGQLPPATYQIVNINANGYREIGFWSQRNGLAKTLAGPENASSLSPIIWPGDETSSPKGWVLPTKGKKLRILVPVKNGASPFVAVTTTNATVIEGYTIDVFNAVVNKLPYALPYEFIPDPSHTENYDDLIYQVFLGNYDAAVGDITIVANRSNFVDFSLPYTESGVSILVRSSYKQNHGPLNIFGSFTLLLWIIIIVFIIFTGLVVWCLECRVNGEFQGGFEKVGTMLWFAFCTLFFMQNQKVVSNLARIVVIVWCFVVLVLVQSFTASLASRLTVQQLQPVTVDVQSLISKNAPVGYSSQSFLRGALKDRGFKERNLVAYKTFDECHELFQNGTIVAIIDETPYLEPFMAEHCLQYAAKPAFYTGGFGFVFPIGSPLVPDISRAILEVVTTRDDMGSLQAKWLLSPGNCSDTSAILASSRLDFVNVWVLFVISLVTSLLAVLAHIVLNYQAILDSIRTRIEVGYLRILWTYGGRVF